MRISILTEKLWSGAIYTALMLAAAATASAQLGMMGASSLAMRGTWSPVVGAGAEYQIQITSPTTGAPRTLDTSIAIVGEEDVNGETGYWLEGGGPDPLSGGSLYVKALIVSDGVNTKAVRGIMQMPGHPPMELPTPPLANRPSQPADIRKQAQDMGSESVTVPAGTFTCEHYHAVAGDDVADVWISSKVSPSGMVKMTGKRGGKDISVTLEKTLTDVHDMITGTPVPFQMPSVSEPMIGGGVMGGVDIGPAFRGIWNPVVGAGAEYQTQSPAQQQPTAATVAIIGEEDVNGKAGYWREESWQNPRAGGTAYMKMLIVMDGDNLRGVKIVQQLHGSRPIELPMQMFGNGPEPQPADITKQAQDLGSESVTVPAGTFTCEHYRTAEGDDVWISSKASPWGLVKMTGNHGNMTLEKIETHAQEMMTGTPVQLPFIPGGISAPPPPPQH